MCMLRTHTQMHCYTVCGAHTQLEMEGAHVTLTQTQRDIQFVCVHTLTLLPHLYSTVWGGALSPPLWLAQQPRAAC